MSPSVFPGYGKNRKGFRKIMREPISDGEWHQIRGIVIGSVVNVLVSIALRPLVDPNLRRRLLRFRK